MSNRRKAEVAEAIRVLRHALPATDARATWEPSLNVARRHLRALGFLVGLISLPLCVALTALIIWAAISVSRTLGIRVGVPVITPLVLLAGFAGRGLLASIPGFGWAKEYEYLHDLIVSFEEEITRLQGGYSGLYETHSPIRKAER